MHDASDSRHPISNRLLAVLPPDEFAFIRMQGDFSYLAPGKSHHAAKVLSVPNPSVNRTA